MRNLGVMKEKKFIALAVAGVAAVILFGGFVALHFVQRAHNHLHLDLEAMYPHGQSYVPGEIIGTALHRVMEHELDGAIGWRPNDFFLWGPWVGPDNNAHRQLGIIHTMRETTRVFRDNLTKVSAEVYDPNLLVAETMLRNDAKRWILPSAEDRFEKGTEALKRYVLGLKTEPQISRPLNQRNIELIRLFEAWCDILGDAHANLYREHEPDGSAVSTWDADDYFYEAQGATHVMYYVLEAVELEYGENLRPTVKNLVSDVVEALHHASTLKPMIVLDGCLHCLRANHRANMDGLVSEAWSKMVLIREELEK
ncbi:MAG: DUF2333 family protein [bacterium]